MLMRFGLFVLLFSVGLVSGQTPAPRRAYSAIRSADSRATAYQESAERVFSTSASKVVFLLTRKKGTLHARASGIILTPDGYIATNYHALQGGDEVEVRFFPSPENSDHYEAFHGAKVLFADQSADVAILKIEALSLPYLDSPVGKDSNPRIGETVFAIGNPKGLTNTISAGIISGMRTSGGEEVIQNTAPISPGSSGGALVDSRGLLLGMNSWQLEDAQNVNFAISAKHLMRALATARIATVALEFPSETLADATAPTEQLAWQAFKAKDYIQARNQAEQLVAGGFSNAKIYMILGKTYVETGGDKAEAERYFRQGMSLAGADDEFKQSCRLYLLQVLGDRFVANSLSVDRLALISLMRNFLSSNSKSVEDPILDNKMRDWATVSSQYLASIEGDWSQWSSDRTLLPGTGCTPNFRISKAGAGKFTVGWTVGKEWIGSDRFDLACEFNGTIESAGGRYTGKMITLPFVVGRPRNGRPAATHIAA
jgi:Trypsin-like peptidase domain